MRFFVPAIAVLLLASSAGLAAQGRSSSLGVRVTVVRSCAISTDGQGSAGASVTCSTGQMRPVVTTSTTTMAAATPPSPATTSTDQPTPTEHAASLEQASSQAAIDLAALTQASGTAAEATPEQPPIETIRVVTINF